MGCEGRDYWEAQLSEYWESDLTIQEYSELKELPYESSHRWIRVLQKICQDGMGGSASLELVEVKPLSADTRNGSGVRLRVDGIEISVKKRFRRHYAVRSVGSAQGAVMFRNGGSVRIYYCPTPVNLRKSFDGLAGAMEEYIKQDPESGHVFAFFSRNKS